MSFLCRRLWRLLHGALHLSPGNAPQLAVTKTGQRVPHRSVRECRGPTHQDYQRSETNLHFMLLFLNIIIVATKLDLWFCFYPCSSVSHVWLSQPAISGLVHPSESPLFFHLSQISFWQTSLVWVLQQSKDLTFLGWPPSAISVSDVWIIYGLRYIYYSLF